VTEVEVASSENTSLERMHLDGGRCSVIQYRSFKPSN
jgi:hypothetical protein